MSIKALALELYRAQQKVSAREKELEDAALGERDAVRRTLDEARREYSMLRKMMDGEKETSSRQKPYSLPGRYTK